MASCEKTEDAAASGGAGGRYPVFKCAKLLRNQKVPKDAKLLVWFDRLKKMFATYGVPDLSKVHLITLVLSSKVAYIFLLLTTQDLPRHSAVKATVLDELKVTS